MLKKAFIYNPYWLTMGGGERYTATVAQILINWGWEVDVYWPQNLSQKIYDRFGINLSHVKFVNSDWTYKYDLVFWLSDGSLPTSFAKQTLVHFQFPFTNPKITIIDRIKSKQYIFVCNSKFTKHFVDLSYSTNSLVLYPPIDVNSFSPQKKVNTILYVGRFSKLTQAKNQELLIDSFRRISKKIPGWRLVLAGGLGVGYDKIFINRLKSKAQNYNIEFIFNPEMSILKKLYGQAKIFWGAAGYGKNEILEPTLVEHFGMTVVEAMSAGVVPILCNLGGYKEILDFKSGFLWDKSIELENITLNLIKQSSILAFMSKAAINRAKMFDKVCFQNSLASIIG